MAFCEFICYVDRYRIVGILTIARSSQYHNRFITNSMECEDQPLDLTNNCSLVHRMENKNDFVLKVEVSPPCSQLLSPGLPECSAREPDIRPAPFALHTPPFVGPHGFIGAFQPYPTLLPLVPDTKTSPLLGQSSSVLGSALPSSSKRPRGEKKPIPDEQKDDKYYERRKRNNQAAKKSRDARKLREDQIAFRAAMLEQENAILRAQVLTLRDEAETLKHLLFQKKATDQQTSNSADTLRRSS